MSIILEALVAGLFEVFVELVNMTPYGGRKRKKNTKADEQK